MKAWCDFQNYEDDSKKMPTGFVITIWVTNNFSSDSRDDVAMKNTLNNIYNKLSSNFSCLRPTTPKDENVMDGYSYQTYFMDKLKAFLDSAIQAINETNPKNACHKWQKHLGSRFSCANAKDEDEGAKAFHHLLLLQVTQKVHFYKMMDFEAAKIEAFESLKLTNNIEKVRIKTKSKFATTIFKEFWKITVEISHNEKVNDYNLLLNVKSDFPLSLPEIYLSEPDYEKIKYLPHVDHQGNICLFDQENIKIDSERPVEIIRICLERAKKIILDGITKTNNSDFKDEVVAYWTDTYNSKDRVINGYLGDGLEELIPGKVKINFLAQPYNKTHIYFENETISSLKVIDFFKLLGHNIKQQDAFYLGTINHIEPPFYFNNGDLLNFIKVNFALHWQEVKSYINQNASTKILIFSVKVEQELIFLVFI